MKSYFICIAVTFIVFFILGCITDWYQANAINVSKQYLILSFASSVYFYVIEAFLQITAAYVVGATFQKGFLLESLVILIASIISVFAIHTNSSVGTMVVAGYELIKNGKPTLFMYIYKFAFVYIAYIAWRVFTAPKPLSF